MKKFILTLLIVMSAEFLSSQTFPTYNLKATNFNRNAPDSLMFDIYMLHTNPSVTNFQYALGQYFFKFNPNIANGGTLTYKIVDSQLPIPARPRNPTVTGDELRLATNAVLGFGNGPSISSTDSGTLIVRMSIKTSASSFASNQLLNLTWKNLGQPVPYTKVFAYLNSDSMSHEITTPATHTVNDPLSVHQISSEIPQSFNLSQNYPNPFNPKTIIHYDIALSSAKARQGLVSLKVYNLLGNEVAVLVNEKQQPGSYSADWDASNYPSGVYFYKLVADGVVIDTKRMMLVK